MHTLRLFRYLPFFLLFVYSIALLKIDITDPQENVRGYFSDIVDGVDYPLPYSALYGINTTLTVALLVGISILFSVCIGTRRLRKYSAKELIFVWSQFGFFFYLALDERLKIHEKAGGLLGINDAFYLMGLGVAELVILVYAGDLLKQKRDMQFTILAASMLFGLMVLIDAFAPAALPGRLAVEDLSKTWAIALLYLYSWKFCMMWLSEISKEADSGD